MNPIFFRRTFSTGLLILVVYVVLAGQSGHALEQVEIDTLMAGNDQVTDSVVSSTKQQLHGFFITMRSHLQRQEALLKLLAHEPAGQVKVEPHVADYWYTTIPGTPAEPHVTDSHVAVLRRCIDLGLPTCLIMEDDAVWDTDSVTLHSTFNKALDDLEGRLWDVIVLGHNLLRGRVREMKNGPFTCEADLEIVTPSLARLAWRTAWGCQAYVVHERYYGTLISKIWASPRYACIEEFTNIAADRWFLTSPLPVSQAAKRSNFAHAQKPYLSACNRISPNVTSMIFSHADTAQEKHSNFKESNSSRQRTNILTSCNIIYKGDAACDTINNVRACDWDGGDCVDRRPFNTIKATINKAALAFAANATVSLQRASAKNHAGGQRQPFPHVHLLHVPKSGGLSVRSALGCFCGSDDYSDVTGGLGAGNCDRTTKSGPFICHGHAVTCEQIPKDEPYAVFFRDPYTKVRSANAHQRAIFPGLSVAESALVRRKRSPHQKAQSDYIACSDHLPTFIGHTETLAEDWERFVKTFALEIELVSNHDVPKTLPHRHDKKKRGAHAANDMHTRLGPALNDSWVEWSWRRQISVQYRADFELGPYDVRRFPSSSAYNM